MTRISAIATLFVLCSCASEWLTPSFDFSVTCEEREDGNYHLFEVVTQDSLKYVNLSLYANWGDESTAENHSLQKISDEDNIQIWQLELSFTKQTFITPGKTTYFRCDDERISEFTARSGNAIFKFGQVAVEIDEGN